MPHDSMTPSQRNIYTSTAAVAEALDHLDREGALAIPLREAAVKMIERYDELAEADHWPADWRNYAHVHLDDLT